MACQPIQHGVRLPFRQLQVLEEKQQLADLVEGQADVVHQKSDLRDNLQAKLAAAKHARNFPILLVGAAINLVGNQRGLAVFQAPHRADVRQLALLRRDTFGVNAFSAFGLVDLVLGLAPTTTPLALGFGFPAARLLPLLFGAQRKRLVQFRRRRQAGHLLLEHVDAVRGCMELLLRRLE